LGFILLVCLGLGNAVGAMADEPSRVAIVPFRIHADRDLSFLKEGILDMLTLRLSSADNVVVIAREETAKGLKKTPWPVNETSARAFGTSLPAHYVVFGSVTIFGNSVSLDAKMVDVSGPKSVVAFSKDGDNLDEVIPQISLFAAEARENILARAVSPGLAGKEPGAEPLETITQAKPPVVAKSKEQAAVPEPTSQPAAPVPSGTATTGAWKSSAFKSAIVGIALGDVDGDTKTELVFIGDRRIDVYRFQSNRLLKVKDYSGNRSQRFIGVDVADVNGNGYSEIFVTSLKGTGQNLDSFVLEWDGRDLRKITEDQRWYYRVIDKPQEGKVLLGQKRTIKDLFVPGVYHMAWDAGTYAPQEPLTLPEGTNIFGFTQGDVMNDGRLMTVTFDKDERIRIYGPSGEEEWITDEPYGGTMKYLEFTSPTDLQQKDRHYLPQRIFVHDLNRDGRNDVIVASNRGTLGRRLSTLRLLTSGHLVALSWGRLGLAATAQTRKTKGYISDVAIGDLNNDGRKEVVVAQVQKVGRIIKHDKSFVAAYSRFTPPSSTRE
jgi:TolB-like protein